MCVCFFVVLLWRFNRLSKLQRKCHFEEVRLHFSFYIFVLFVIFWYLLMIIFVLLIIAMFFKNLYCL